MQCTGVSSPEDCLTKVTCSDQYVSLYFLVFLLNFDLKVKKRKQVHEAITESSHV